jgi:hypothetical protein
MKLGQITSRAAEDPAPRRSGLSESDPGSQPVRPARTDAARPAEERQKEATDAAIAQYRRLSPLATGDKLAVSGEVRIVAISSRSSIARLSLLRQPGET